jgi:hypothetical protein
MFDHAPTYVNRSQHTSIRVEQQPHDAADAARLHGEMRESVLKEIIQRIPILENTFKCEVMQMPSMGQDCYLIVFDLNGRRIRLEYEADYNINTRDDLIRGLATKISNAIAIEMILPLLNESPLRYAKL